MTQPLTPLFVVSAGLSFPMLLDTKRSEGESRELYPYRHPKWLFIKKISLDRWLLYTHKTLTIDHRLEAAVDLQVSWCCWHRSNIPFSFLASKSGCKTTSSVRTTKEKKGMFPAGIPLSCVRISQEKQDTENDVIFFFPCLSLGSGYFEEKTQERRWD